MPGDCLPQVFGRSGAILWLGAAILLRRQGPKGVGGVRGAGTDPIANGPFIRQSLKHARDMQGRSCGHHLPNGSDLNSIRKDVSVTPLLSVKFEHGTLTDNGLRRDTVNLVSVVLGSAEHSVTGSRLDVYDMV